MIIKAMLSQPSVRREGNKWVLGFDELHIWEFSEDDIPIFERLYELGWKPSDEFLETMCQELPADFILKHEPRDRVVRILLQRVRFDIVKKFASVLTAEEKKAMVQETIERRRQQSLYYLRDYNYVLPLIETFREVFREIPIPTEFVERLLEDLSRWQGWVKCPVAYGHESYMARDFRSALEVAVKLKELGLLPPSVEQQAKMAVLAIRKTLERRLTSHEIEKKDLYAKVAKAALQFADEETKSKILSALLEMGNGR